MKSKQELFSESGVVDLGHEPEGIDKLHYSVRDFLCILHGMDHCRRTVGDVAPGKDTFTAGHAVGIVACEHIAFVDNFYALCTGDYPAPRLTSDGHHNFIGG